jgi:hypothetical protein
LPNNPTSICPGVLVLKLVAKKKKKKKKSTAGLVPAQAMFRPNRLAPDPPRLRLRCALFGFFFLFSLVEKCGPLWREMLQL